MGSYVFNRPALWGEGIIPEGESIFQCRRFIFDNEIHMIEVKGGLESFFDVGAERWGGGGGLPHALLTHIRASVVISQSRKLGACVHFLQIPIHCGAPSLRWGNFLLGWDFPFKRTNQSAFIFTGLGPGNPSSPCQQGLGRVRG